MGNKGMDFKKKEVININDAKRLGFVQDVCADLESGKIEAKNNAAIEFGKKYNIKYKLLFGQYIDEFINNLVKEIV